MILSPYPQSLTILFIVLTISTICSTNAENPIGDDVRNSYLHKLVRYYEDIFARNLQKIKQNPEEKQEQNSEKPSGNIFLLDDQEMIPSSQLNQSGEVISKTQKPNVYNEEEEKNNEIFHKLLRNVNSEIQIFRTDEKSPHIESFDKEQITKNEMMKQLFGNINSDINGKTPVLMLDRVSGSRKLWDPHAFLSSQMGHGDHGNKKKVGRSDDYREPLDPNRTFFVVNPLNSKLPPGNIHTIQSILDDLEEKAFMDDPTYQSHRNKRMAVSEYSNDLFQPARSKPLDVPVASHDFYQRGKSRRMVAPAESIPEAFNNLDQHARSRRVAVPVALHKLHESHISKRIDNPASLHDLNLFARSKNNINMYAESNIFDRRARNMRMIAPAALNDFDQGARIKRLDERALHRLNLRARSRRRGVPVALHDSDRRAEIKDRGVPAALHNLNRLAQSKQRDLPTASHHFDRRLRSKRIDNSAASPFNNLPVRRKSIDIFVNSKDFNRRARSKGTGVPADLLALDQRARSKRMADPEASNVFQCRRRGSCGG